MLRWKLLFNLLLVSYFLPAQAATSLLIWPIDPVIEDTQQAAALWLENHSPTSAYLQIRIQKWSQSVNQDHHAPQQEILASPPVAMVEPGKKQLIRLIKKSNAPAGQEVAYRIFVDEIPRPDEPKTKEPANSVGLRFQMRYSIPLFVSGAGIWTKQNAEINRDPATQSQPELSYTLSQKKGEQWLHITNNGKVHARLSLAYLTHNKQQQTISNGLLGYVLPGSTMAWQLPKGILTDSKWQLKINVNDNQQATILPRR